MKNERLTILVGDCREMLKEIADESIDSCVTDPPYDLTANKKGGSGVASVNLDTPHGRARIGTGNGKGGFMGLAWDSTGVAFDPATWREVFRVLKPGAHLLAFGGTRTYHRMACAIEDAGFEIRDQIGWAYGSGFPKSLDVSKAIDKAAGAERKVVGTMRTNVGIQGGNFTNGSQTGEVKITAPTTEAAKQWDGWGTALKPAWEPICVARKPISGTVAENVQQHGTGALNIDGCRVAHASEEDRSSAFPGGRLTSHGSGSLAGPGAAQDVTRAGFEAQQSPIGRWPANLIHDGSDEVVALFPAEAGAAAPVTARNGDKFRNTFGKFAGNIDEQGSTFQGDAGSAARFFYCAKVSPSERGDSEHPTMKPLALMRYLVRLVTPPGGMTLDPFGGSGTTAVAAIEEGFSITVCELDPENAALIHRRTDVTPGLAL